MRILIAGIGNIFLNDDAFGIHVAQLLARRPLPPGVRVVDFGIRGLDLAYSLLEDWEALVVLDLASTGEPPGTLRIIEPPAFDHPGENIGISGHSLDLPQALRLARSMGGHTPRVLIIGCEPGPMDPDGDLATDLSPQVRAAIAPAAELAESLVNHLIHENPLPEIPHERELPQHV
jgi:hydrogenase maturation protease